MDYKEIAAKSIREIFARPSCAIPAVWDIVITDNIRVIHAKLKEVTDLFELAKAKQRRK